MGNSRDAPVPGNVGVNRPCYGGHTSLPGVLDACTGLRVVCEHGGQPFRPVVVASLSASPRKVALLLQSWFGLLGIHGTPLL